MAVAGGVRRARAGRRVSREYWEVIVDYFYGEWTYGVYPTEEQARAAAEGCTHIKDTIRIRRV